MRSNEAGRRLSRRRRSHRATAVAARTGRGRVRLQRDRFVDSLFDFLVVQRLHPQSWVGYYWAGCAQAWVADYPQAEASFTQALTVAAVRGGPLGRAHEQRAYCRLQQGRAFAALEDLVAAETAGSLADDARLIMAGLRLRGQEWDAAESLLRSVGAGDSGRGPAAWAMRGLVAEHRGAQDEALTFYDRAIGVGCTDTAVRGWYALAAYRAGRFPQSAQAWAQLERFHPERSWYGLMRARAIYGWAADLAAAGEHTAAIDRLTECARLLPPATTEAAMDRLALHSAAARQGPPDRTVALLEARLARHPDDARTQYGLALHHLLAGHVEPAEVLLRKVVALRPTDDRARYALACCRAAADDPEAAELELAGLGRSGEETLRRPVAAARAALRIRHADWSAAAAALGALADDDPWRAALLPECEYRCGGSALPAARSGVDVAGVWHASELARQGRIEVALDVWRHGGGAAGPGAARAERELAAWLWHAALAPAGTGDWPRAAEILLARREVAGEAGGPWSYPLVEAVVLLLGGHRPAALERLAAESARDPADGRIGHVYALMLFHALAARGEGGSAAVPAGWPQCIAAWATLLHDTAFLAGWAGAAERRYGQPLAPGSLAALPSSLHDLLETAMAPPGTAPVVGDPGGTAPGPAVLLRWETEAAGALARTGGLPLPDRSGRHLVCGPRRIAELGLEHELGRHLAAPGAPDGSAEPLRLLFSQLGAAQVLLLDGRLREAGEALADVRCPACRTGPNGAAARQRVCLAGCAGFDAANPAYALLPDKHWRFGADAAALSVEVLFGRGQVALTAGPPLVGEAERCWRDAILRTPGPRRDAVRRRVNDTALGRASVWRRRDEQEPAIGVLDAARAVCGGSPQVDGALADILTDHGITLANQGPDRLREPVGHLRRAVGLNPYMARAVLNLAMALRLLARQTLEQGAIGETRALLDEAATHLHRALRHLPGRHDLLEQLDLTMDELHVFDQAIVALFGASGRRR